MSKSKINENLHIEICEKYRSGKTCTELAKEYGVSYGPILKILHKYDEPVFHRTSEKNLSKTNNFNTNFFIEESEKLGYLMGFALADGCLKQNYKTYTYSLKFAISIKDKHLLEMFCDWTNFNKNKLKISKSQNIKHKNKVYACQPICSLLFQDKKLFTSDFSKWGIVPNKTYIGKAPTITDKKILLPFILGLIDGDGCLSFTNKRRQFGLVCNINIILWFEKVIKELGYNGSYQLIFPKNKPYARFLINRKRDLLKFGKILEINNYDYIMKRKWDNLKAAVI